MSTRLCLLFLAALAVLTFAGVPDSVRSAPKAGHTFLDCKTRRICADVADSDDLFGSYIGHDEPALNFYSNTPGSGNSSTYHLILPADPLTPPRQDGSGGAANFHLHPTFWFGMAVCDPQ